MDVNKTLIAMSVAAALTTGLLPGSVSAKKADEDDSVYRWGRWAVLAPAAGVEELPAFPAVAGNEIGRCEADANCPQPQREDTDGDKPDDEKPPVGAPVGYARIDYRVSGSNRPYDRYVGGIGLTGDGTDGSMEFQVTGPSAPDGDDVNLKSGPLTVVAVGTDRFRSNPDGSLSALSGRYTRGADGEIALIDGTWRQVAADGAYNHSGQYFWGITATDAEIAALKDQLRDPEGLPGQDDITARYTGSTATGGSILLDMNLSAATWRGSVDGRILDFTASGGIENAHFTANSFELDSDISGDITGAMEGDLVNAGNNAIGGFTVEVVEYESEDVLREADVFNAGLQEPTAAVAAQ